MVQSVASLFLLPAFVVSFHSVSLPQPSFLNNVRSTTLLRGTITDAYGLPCDDECAVDKFPNLPDSVHPGIVTGQALRDLLDHAKENGKIRYILFRFVFYEPQLYKKHPGHAKNMGDV